MPFQIGSVAIHNDGQHTGSAKRDTASGIAGLDAGGDVLAPGANLDLTRDGNGDIKIIERTSGETVAVMRRTGANAFTLYNNTVAGGKTILDSSMDLSATYAVAAKGVTGGDSHDHSGGDGAQIVLNGNYAGNNTSNRAVAHGLGHIPKYVYIIRNSTGALFSGMIVGGNGAVLINDNGAQLQGFAVTAMDATNFYVGSGAGPWAESMNNTGNTYYYVAVG